MSETSNALPVDQDLPRPRVGDSSQGFVLVAVLGALTLLAAIAIAISVTARSRARIASNLTQNAEIQGVADGVARLLALQFSRLSQGPPDPKAILIDGQNHSCELDGYTVRFSLTNPAGLLDINAASPELVAQILRGMAVSEPAASKLAAAIADFRDGDEERQVGGKEQEDYTAAGLPHGAKNAPFDDVNELDQVAGMTPAVLDQLRDLTTVQSRAPFVDETVAPQELIDVLDRGQIGSQANASVIRVQKSSAPTDPSASPATSTPRTLKIVVLVQNQRGGEIERHAVVELAPALPIGFQFREWSRRGGSSRSQRPATTPLALQPCAALF